MAVVALVALTVAHTANAEVAVEIDPSAELGPVRRDVYGANLEYIGAANAELEALVVGTPIVRFPGGDDVSQFLWNESGAGTCAEPRWTWDRAARLAAREGIGMLLETNAVRGTPANTAAWVRDARARGLRVPYVEIGNEPWGHWDAGYRTAARYADEVRATAAAVRAVAPDTRIVLSIGTFNEDSWNREAVRRTADVIDAVDYHYYPNHLASPDPLSVAAGADGVAPLLARIRAMLRAEAGPARADAIELIVGEWDGASDPPPRGSTPVPGRAYAQWSVANALFYGVALGEMLHGGVAAAMFYEVQGYRFGAVSGDACNAQLTPGARRPKELALRLYREHFGDRLVAVNTSVPGPTFTSAGPTNWDGFAGSAPYVKVFASTADGGDSLRLMVTNRDPTRAHTVDFLLRAFDPAPTARAWEIAGGAIMDTNENVGGAVDAVRTVERAVAVPDASWTFTAPAHSVTAIELRRRAVTTPDAGRAVDAATLDAATPDAATLDAGARPGVTTPHPPGASGCRCSAAPAGERATSAYAASTLALAVVTLARRARRRRAMMADRGARA